MTKLIYSAFISLDGYVADETGNFDWAELSDEVHAFINSRERQIGTYLFGRKIYETVAVWESPDAFPDLTLAAMEFAPIWQAAERIVYSTSLQRVTTAKTRLERRFEADNVRELKAGAIRDLEVGGPTLAAHAIRAGLVDGYHLLICPDHRGRRQSLSARQGLREARTSRRTQVRQRSGLRSVPSEELMRPMTPSICGHPIPR
jgi:dihydrofolate reductase